MRVLVTGATGFLGSHLIAFLQERGYATKRLTRNPSQTGDISWNPAEGKIDKAKFQSINAVVHLAGDNIADGRWTEAKKQRILDSRVKGTQLLSATLANLSKPERPEVFISASAVGYYGSRGDEVLTEESLSGDGFLAEVCRQWEAATHAAEQAGIRTIHLRNGLVAGTDGGALRKILPLFKLGLGGSLGDGQQYWSWISLTDWLNVVLHCLTTKTISGPVNAVAPHPVKNVEFTRLLGSALHRPTLVPVPEFAVRLALGDMADELLFASQRVTPKRLQSNDYEFIYPTLETALQALLKHT